MGMTISSQAEVRTCTQCHQEKQLFEFYFRPSKGGRWDTKCKTCVAEYNESAYQKSAERRKEKQRAYAAANRLKIRDYFKRDVPKRHMARKELVFNHYGRVCVCCGEANLSFLTIDHVDGDGAAHKKLIGRSNLYWWIIRNSFPASPRFQVLCYNCNMGRYRNGGICPHKTSEGSETIRKE